MDVVEIFPTMENQERIPNMRMKSISLKDAQLMFRPFEIVEAMFVVSRFKIKGNLVVPNSLRYNVFSGIFAVLLSVFIIYTNLRSSYASGLTGLDFVKFFCDVQDVIVLVAGCLISFILNVVKAPSNALLPLNTQNLCEIICVHGQRHIINDYIFVNWLYVVYSILAQILWILVFKYAFNEMFEVDQVVSYIVYIIYDTHVLYGARFIKLMRKALQIWIHDARRSPFLSDFEKEDYWNNLFAVYMEIFDAYKTAVDVFDPAVSEHLLNKCLCLVNIHVSNF